MIRPKSLTLRGFKAHKDTTISLDAPIVHVIGKERQGKTSIRFALEYNLSGTCPGLTADGKLADQLIGLDSASMETSFAFEMTGKEGSPPKQRVVIRGRKNGATEAGITDETGLIGAAKTDAVNAMLTTQAKISRDLVAVLMDAPKILRSSDDDASRLLSSVLAGAMNLQQMLGFAKEITRNLDPTGQWLTRELFPEVDGKTAASVDRSAFDAASKKWREERRVLGAERKGLKLVVPESAPPDAAILAGMDARLAKYRLDEREQSKRLGALEEHERVRSEAAGRVETLRQRASMEPTIPTESAMAIQARLDMREKRLKEILGLETCKEPHPCPVQYAPAMCPLSGKKSGGLTPTLKKERDTLWTAQAVDRGLMTRHEAVAQHAAEYAEINTAQRILNAMEDRSELVAKAQASLAELRSWIADLDQSAGDLRTRAAAWNGAQKARSRDEEIGKRLEELAALIPLVDPSGIPATAAHSNCSKVARFCNTLLEVVLPGYKIGFDLDGETGRVLPVVLKPGFDQPIPTPQLSDSETIIIGAIIGRAIGLRSGFPLSVVDRCESIAEDTRVRFIEALRKADGTTVLISVVDDISYPPFPIEEGELVYSVENGAVVKLSQEGGVA